MVGSLPKVGSQNIKFNTSHKWLSEYMYNT